MKNTIDAIWTKALDQAVPDTYTSLTWTQVEKIKQVFAELIVRQCGYYADIFEAAGCPVDMDPTDTKPSDYIKQHFGVKP